MMLRLMSLVLALAMSAAYTATESFKADPEWERYKAAFKKTYKDSDDESTRYSLFNVAKARVAELNKLNGKPAFGINWMSDRYICINLHA